MKSSEVLQEAQRVLLERGWLKGNFFGDEGQVCARGALLLITDIRPHDRLNLDPPYLGAALQKRAGTDDVVWYNDDPSTTFNDIYSLFDDAIRLAKEAGD